MTLKTPYAPELMRIARKVVWFDAPEQTLADLPTFLAHLMVYGLAADVVAVERYVPQKEFRRALQNAPAGVFTRDAWTRWHQRFAMLPIPPLPPAPVSGWLNGTRARRFLRPVA